VKRFAGKFAKKIFDWYNSIWINGKIHATSVADECDLASHVKISKHSYCFKTTIGSYSYLAGFNIVANASIGKFCSIGSFVSIGPGMHPTHTYVSTSPVFFSPHKQCGNTFADRFYFQDSGKVVIGNDVWIGNNVVILDNVTIGDGAIIAAGAIVNKNVAPYTIVGGVPARRIKTRFSEDQIKKLLESKWWEKNEKWLKDNLQHMHNVDSFLESLNQNTPVEFSDNH